MSKTIKDRNQYLCIFSGPPSDYKLREQALKCALDIRKFEIELYWKRATYFWTLITAAFTGYFALASAEAPKPGLVFLVSCLGLLLSTAWYLVNRGSKFWQENWETHVNLLENEIMGPLYKTTISKNNFRLWKFWSGYPYSVSKVNQIVSLFVLSVWLGLTIRSFSHHLSLTIHLDVYWLLGIVTGLFVLILFKFGLSTVNEETWKINLEE